MDFGYVQVGTMPIVALALVLVLVISVMMLLGSSSGGMRAGSSWLKGIGKGGTKDTIVLAGPSGSGKTTLFFRFTQHRFIETCTSMQENTAKLILDSTTPK
ncbi:hypothetical protein BASA62_005660 [Batrachochytrium salamandrivorans]|nr:hypothetical protein BASA62_005660 [Batrachochytrium salamandrivorans]